MKHFKRVGATLALLLVSLLSIYPFYVMIVMSTHTTNDLFKKINLLPGSSFLQNLKTVLDSGFTIYYLNSLYVAVLTILFSVTISSICGYAFAKYQFPLKKPLFLFIVANMMVPPQLGLIAYVIEMRVLRLVNTHLPLIAIYAASSYGVFFSSQFVKSSMPDEVIESARIEGCSEWGILLRIGLPFMAPCLSTLAILIFMWSWNAYLLPLVLINSRELYTIPLGIATLGNYYRTDYAAQICGLMLGTVPLILLFAAGSKYFVKGLSAGAVKG